MNVDIENTVKQCATCLGYQQTQPHKKTVLQELFYKPWEVVGDNIFSINNSKLLCIVDYDSIFPVMEKADGFQQTT